MSIRPTTSPALADQLKDPAYSAYVLLRTLFTVAPILFGLDKFFNLLTHPQHWNMYLAGWINDLPAPPTNACTWSGQSRLWPAYWLRSHRASAPG